MLRVGIGAVVLAASAAAVPAQDPNAAPPPAAAGITSEPLAEPPSTATEPVLTPTRRPTRPPTPTGAATSTATVTVPETESPTAVPPTVAPTQPRPPTSTTTATAPPALPTPTRTATLIAGVLPLALDAQGAASLLPFAIGGGLALVSVWLGARLASARARGERRRARRTLATTMLLELRRVDAVLRRVVALDNPASFPSLDHPIMEAALRDLTLFDTATAARIAQFHGALRGIQHEIGDYRDNPLRWAGRLGELNQLIKGRAAAACRAVPELRKALEQEGGTPPPPLGEPSPGASPGKPGLPPPPFGATDGDDWTL
jgi:hypothetical protein